MPDPLEPSLAPEFGDGLAWLNVERAPKLRDLRGRVVLLAFWTSSAIECAHDAARLRAIGTRFPNELAVIGVHAPKFAAEKATANVREAVLRLAIEHPVVNDADAAIRRSYSVRATPSFALVDPEGRVLRVQLGEIDVEALAGVIERVLAEHREHSALAAGPLATRSETLREPARTLAHPAKLLAAGERTLFVADTGHHRVLQLELDAGARSARIERTFGSGEAGFADGAIDVARFDAPHGLARRGSHLYVADTRNHTVRVVDLDTNVVRTIAGTGELASELPRPGALATQTALRSPCALWVDHQNLYVATAGSHQVLALEDETSLRVLAGDGREALADGLGLAASLAQPSDLACDGRRLFVADAQASAVRAIELVGAPHVATIVGRGLATFGDVDGVGDDVRLQHALGLAFDGYLYVADSFNHRVKYMDPTTRKTARFAGNGEPGFVDGPFHRARFSEPRGLSVRGPRLFVADTNNHAIRVLDLETRMVRTLAIAD